jgi:hypothetical protein
MLQFPILLAVLPFAVSAAIPVRYLPFYAATIAMLTVTYLSGPAGPDHSSPL